jgi:hypothetical protein
VSRPVSRPAQLARVAARASAEGTSAVDFRVVHTDLASWKPSLGEREWASLLREPSLPLGDSSDSWPHSDSRDEMLYMNSAGVQVQIVTSPSRDRNSTRGAVTATVVKGLSNSSAEFAGQAILNPGFLYESAQGFEVLLTYGDAIWRPSFRESLITTFICRKLSEMAVTVAAAPILFMHAPSASAPSPDSPDQSDSYWDEFRRPTSSSVRMSVAIDGERPERRMLFQVRLREFAEENGFGLQTASLMPGRVRGEWRVITNFEKARYESQAEHLLSSEKDHDVLDVRSVTVAGPARIGSSLAVLRAMESRGVGIVAVSVSALQEVAFINLLIAAEPAHLLFSSDPSASTLLPGLQQTIGSVGGRTQRQGSPDWDFGDVGPASDYMVLAGPKLRSRFVEGGGARYPLWIVWDVPLSKSRPDMRLLKNLVDSLEEQTNVTAPVVEYVRSRRSETDRLRGRAKISIELPSDKFASTLAHDELRAELTQIAEDLETSCRLKSSRLGRTEEQRIRLRVMWREPWLGGWPAIL